MQRLLILASLLTASWSMPVAASPAGLDAVREGARGQTVYFKAWGGSTQINDHIAGVGDEVADRYGIALVHVTLTDTSEAAARVIAEKAVGRAAGGSVDLVWLLAQPLDLSNRRRA